MRCLSCSNGSSSLMKTNPQRLVRIIRNFRRHTVGVLGDFMLDELLRGEATRISPEAPVPVLLMRDWKAVERYPGGAANAAANLSALGARAVAFGAVGNDESARRLFALLKRRRISCDTLVRESHRITPHKVRIVAHQQQLLRVDVERPENISPRTGAALVRSFARWVGRLDAMIVSDYRKGSVTTAHASQMETMARQRRVPVFVDPKPDHPEICRYATVITPNLREAELMIGRPMHGRRQLESGGRRLLESLQCSYVLVTRGAEGMTLLCQDGTVHHIPGVTRPVYDVTGAGDTVIAVLALAYCSGATMKEAAELANLAGGRVVLKFGTAQITWEELLEAVRERD